MTTFPELTSSQTPESLDYFVPKLDQSDFDKLVADHGYRVKKEQAVKCPCTSRNIQSPLMTCINCGGRGWKFTEDESDNIIVLQSMNRNSKYETWTEANTGTVQITARWKNRLAVMDRITLLDSEDIFSENLNFYMVQDKPTAYSIYNIKAIEKLFFFKGDDKELYPLKENIDYTFSLNKIVLKGSLFKNMTEEKVSELGISIRYTFNPQYLVVDISRNIMSNSRINCNSELESQNFPIRCVGRIAHYVLNLNSE